MADFPLCRLRAVLDFSQQRRLDPDASMGDLLAVGLRLPDKRLEARLQVLCGHSVKTVIDLARVNQVPPLMPAEIKAIPFFAVECEPGNRQRLALGACDFYPFVAAT
jgi:hypothetical protein